jgi:cellulose synthase (UDP-forming)
MDAFGLSFLVIGGLILVLPLLDPKDNRARAALLAICIILTWRYIGWRFSATLPPFAWRLDSLYPWAFSTIEALANVGWTLGFITLSRTKDRSREATEQRVWIEQLPRPPRVDVLIATYNEEESILARTIVGAQALDFPGIRVWVLDDGRREWLEELCRSKVRYLSRPDNRHAKGGNINHALKFLREDPDPPEFVAIFDADFVPHREFLWRTMPLFHDPAVGLVQTPQHFFNNDPIQFNLLLGKVWPDEQRFFFDHVMPSKDAWNAAFCCGTSSVARVCAIEEAGGFPIDSVTEDFLVTLHLDRAGWRTIYLNERLSAGLAPEGMKEYTTQRGRWCLGLMQILRSPIGPLSRGRLSFSYRFGLIDAFFYWVASSAFKLFCLLAPIVFWFTGLTVGAANSAELIDHFLPYYAAVMLTLYWITGGLIQPVLTDVCHILTMPAALKGAVTGLIRPRGQQFMVTAKGVMRNRVVVQWPMVARYGVLIALTIGGMLYAAMADYTPERLAPDLNAIVLFWSAYNVVVLLLAMAVCVELPRYRREERFSTSEPVEVSIGDRVFVAPLADISAYGARVRAPLPGRAEDVVWLKIEEIGEVAARIVYRSDTVFAVEFVGADRLRDAMIRKLFSGRYDQRPPPEAIGRRLMRALIARALR